MAIVAATSLTTAAAVAAGGPLALWGSLPRMRRCLLVGANHARLIPASALLGGLLLLLADDVARTVLAPLELPAGMLTAALEGPFFLYLAHGTLVAMGHPEAVLTPDCLSQVYGVTVVVTPHPVYGTPLIAPVFASPSKSGAMKETNPTDGP